MVNMEQRLVKRRVVNMLQCPRVCELHRCPHFLLLFCIGLLLITISFNYGKSSGRKEILQLVEERNELQNTESLSLPADARIAVVHEGSDSTAEFKVINDDKKIKTVKVTIAADRKGDSKRTTVVRKDSEEILQGTKGPQTLKITTPKLPSTDTAESKAPNESQTTTTTTKTTITKLPSEIIDVDKEYTAGSPPDVTWPDDVTIQLPVYDKGIPVPKILHLAWYGGSKRGNELKLHHYISFLSAYKRLKPKRILFWHDERPQGQWWESISNQTKHVLQMVKRVSPPTIFGRPIVVPEHHSDVVRLEAVMYYGGTYIDLDVIVLRDFEPLYQYPTAMGYEVSYGLCNGIIVSKPSAPFLIIWYDKYKSFDDKVWSEHSVMLPARLAKQNPTLIHTEAKTMHKPYWGELPQIYNEGVYYDWSNNYSIHLWYRLHGKEHTIDEIKMMNSTYGQISRYTLYDNAKIIVTL